LPFKVGHFQSLQLVPVVLAVGQFRKQVTRHADFEFTKKTSFITVIETLELYNQKLAVMRTATDQLCLSYIITAPKRQFFVVQQVINWIRKGINLHFAAHAVN